MKNNKKKSPKQYRLKSKCIIYDVTARKYMQKDINKSVITYSWGHSPHLFDDKKDAKTMLLFQDVLTEEGIANQDHVFIIMKAYKYGI